MKSLKDYNATKDNQSGDATRSGQKAPDATQRKPDLKLPDDAGQKRPDVNKPSTSTPHRS